MAGLIASIFGKADTDCAGRRLAWADTGNAEAGDKADAGSARASGSEPEQDCTFWFMKADFVRNYKGTQLPFFQEMRDKHPDALEQVTLTYKDVVQGRYVADILATSHRWMEPDSPDPDGEQLKAMKAFLTEPKGRSFKLVWLDAPCMPQDVPRGSRTDEDTALFKKLLPNINMIYLGTSVLLLVDLSYISRFWTQAEAWMSMQFSTPNGLASSVGTPNERHFIRCIHNAKDQADAHAGVLVKTWAGKTSEEAFNVLQRPDVTVTNQRDKQVQLPKIRALNGTVKEAYSVLKNEHELRTKAVDAEFAAAREKFERVRLRHEAVHKEQEALDMAISRSLMVCFVSVDEERRKAEERQLREKEEERKRKKLKWMKDHGLVENDLNYALPFGLDICCCCGPNLKEWPCGGSAVRDITCNEHNPFKALCVVLWCGWFCAAGKNGKCMYCCFCLPGPDYKDYKR